MSFTYKICSRCGKKKRLSSFHINVTRKDGHQGFCKECSKEIRNNYYHKNKKKEKIAAKQRIIDNRKKLIKFFEGKKCVDCGEDNLICLEFDHIKGKKRADVARLLGGGWSFKSILKEIEKCEIVCANCHMKRTAKTFNWLKAKK